MKVYVATIPSNDIFEANTRILGVYKTEDEAEKAVGIALVENASPGEMRSYIEYCQDCREHDDEPVNFSEYMMDGAYYEILDFEIAD